MKSRKLISRILRCPECYSTIVLNENGWKCRKCHRSGIIDRNGIIHLSARDFYYREVPRDFFHEVVNSRTKKEAKEAFDRALSCLPENQRDYILHYALDPNRGGAAALVPIREGTISLDFGSGWGNLTRVISNLGGTVFSVDMTYESLFFSSVMSTNERQIHIRGGKQYPLPFSDNVFDFVFLNGVLEWIPEDYMVNENPKQVQARFLREFFRILKPGGKIIIGIENRNSWVYWSGKPEDHTGLRFGALLPRPIANIYSKHIRKKPYRTYTYTKLGYKKLLQQCMFSSVKFYVPWSRYRNWTQIYTEQSFRLRSFASAKWLDTVRFKKMIIWPIKIMQILHLLSWFVQDYYIIAAKSGSYDSNQPDSLLELIARYEQDGIDSFVINTSSTHTLNFRTRTKFCKLPLTPEATQRIKREIEALSFLRQSNVSDFLVKSSDYRSLKGVEYAVFSAISPGRNCKASRQDNNGSLTFNYLIDFINKMNQDKKIAEIQTTDFWNRVSTDDFIEFVSQFINIEVLLDIMDRLKTKRAPSGMVHGDFCWQNLIFAGNKCFVIDWDKFERFSPKFIDSTHFCINYLERKRGEPISLVFQKLVDGNLPPPFAKLTRIFSGELSHSELLTAYLLDRISKDISGIFDPVFLPSFWYKRNHELFEICKEWF